MAAVCEVEIMLAEMTASRFGHETASNNKSLMSTSPSLLIHDTCQKPALLSPRQPWTTIPSRLSGLALDSPEAEFRPDPIHIPKDSPRYRRPAAAVPSFLALSFGPHSGLRTALCSSAIARNKQKTARPARYLTNVLLLKPQFASCVRYIHGDGAAVRLVPPPSFHGLNCSARLPWPP